MKKHCVYGLVKNIVDAHTMGIKAAAGLLADCGYKVKIANKEIENAIGKIMSEEEKKKFLCWIIDNEITNLGISYRLDPYDAVEMVGKIVYVLKSNGMYETSDAKVEHIFFAGLEEACKMIEKEYEGRIKTFKGGESAEETLLTMGIPYDEIPEKIIKGCQYDKDLMQFGREVISKLEYVNQMPLTRNKYPEFGTSKDTLLNRLRHNFKEGFQPLIRAHSGPYSAEMKRGECISEYLNWCKKLANDGYLDILSIGSSQLSQSNFGENWSGKKNGGGVPIKYEYEFEQIAKAAAPMLVRTYSGTHNVMKMAKIYEDTINISWHALSLWWFDELDGRGPNSLYQNLVEHIETIQYIATTNKPLETNIPHHFAFRGCDDVTYIVSAYLGAKIAKKYGIKTFILQNMLNTPRSTWGIQDIAKSRVMIELIKQLEDNEFKVILQTRAGLDYFKADVDEAKCQLAAVTALMDDIDPYNVYSPDIIHVVSYSEALFLATPEIINDSIKITREALQKYRANKKNRNMLEFYRDDIDRRIKILKKSAIQIIDSMEKEIFNLYTPEGLYLAFVGGWLPVPALWSDSDEFFMARNWTTKNCEGGIFIMDKDKPMDIDKKIDICVSNMKDANYILKQKYGVK